MAFPELLDALAGWVAHHRPSLEESGLRLTAKDNRAYGKWCGTVEIVSLQRVGYLSVWSSGELDCQVLRPEQVLVLNEHRFVQSRAELERVLTTFVEVVGYTDPPELPLPR